VAVSKPSKSAKKRNVLALQALGEQLLGLTDEQLRDMQLDENLFDAVTAARKMTSRNAIRRQCQLIGKYMRNVDPEPIRRALETFQQQEKSEKEIFRRAELWRDRIVQGGQPELHAFFDKTGAENEDLSALLQEYLTTADDPARRASRRKIFRMVHADLATMVQNRAS
jgi:ribosome-associated protein